MAKRSKTGAVDWLLSKLPPMPTRVPHAAACSAPLPGNAVERVRGSRRTHESRQPARRRRPPGPSRTAWGYVLLALAFNAMRIQREPELIALAQRYGSPA